MSGSNEQLPDWDRVLTAAARFQRQFPDAVPVGGTDAAMHAGHRISYDADHVPVDLKVRFDNVLAQLESVAGWRTARVRRPVLILGSLDGIETGVRQFIRSQPLETVEMDHAGQGIVVPTLAEILRIKAVLILKRNATRDCLDFAALASRMSKDEIVDAMRTFDELYPQSSGQSATRQLQVQLSNALPYDADKSGTEIYRGLEPQPGNWDHVCKWCSEVSLVIFKGLCELAPEPDPELTDEVTLQWHPTPFDDQEDPSRY